ncbi:MAG: hypothetical protein EZS28_053365, partial [Streblomastix strix]
MEQARRPTFEENEQVQSMSSALEGLELNRISKQQILIGNIPVQDNDLVDLNNPSYINLHLSDLSSRCVQNYLWNYTEDVISRIRNLIPFDMEQQLVPNQQQIEGSQKGSTATAVVILIDRILQTAEYLNLQQYAFHIPSKLDVTPDSLSRLATSGDYQIRQDVLMEALFALQ